jgi:uncharacterized repeat protein (TIGR01451 family)
VIEPAIQVVETVDPPLVGVGDPVTWEVVVTNVGNDPLTQVVLVDDAGHDYGVPFDLAVGASQTFSYTTHPTMTTENDVTATGLDSLGGAVVDQDSAIVNVINPSIQVEETATPGVIYGGDAVLWEIIVFNNSDDPLTDVTLSDDNGHDYGAAFDLAIGESRTFTYTTSPGANVTNLVTGVGYDSLDRPVSDSATASVKVINPAIEVVKTVSEAEIFEGESVQWTITVYNRGDTLLNEVLVSDSNGMVFGPLTLTADDGDDDGGTDQATWTYETSPAYDTVNVATASGEDMLGKVWTDEDQASVAVNISDDDDDDGIPGYLDDDDDGDGIPDDQECPDGPPCEDTDGDGIPDYLDADDDGDGIPTADECPEGPPCEDTDGDGIPDYLDDDDDGDGIPTADECPEGPPCEDSDGDGVPDYLDPDDDGDGVPTADECPDGPPCEDSDGDGTPDYLDPDDDGDNIPTNVECPDGPPCEDSDGDGIPDYLDEDSDGDGIPDGVEAGDDPTDPVDTDGDGIPDYLDDDSDGDGIPDSVEAGDDPADPDDSDGDGTPDYLDEDSDGDGIPDGGEWSEGPDDPLAGCSADDPSCFDNDADGDGTPNYLDEDSDGDGIPDSEEGLVDSDGDGIPDWLDPDISPQDDGHYMLLPLVVWGW